MTSLAWQLVLFVAVLSVGCSAPAPIARDKPSSSSTRSAVERETPEARSTPGELPTPAARSSPRSVVIRATATPELSKPNPPSESPGEANPPSSLALNLPGPPRPASADDKELVALLAQAGDSGMAAHWRKAGERALKLKLYPQAAKAFRSEAAIYRSKGFTQAALAQEGRADQYSTELGFYLCDSKAPNQNQPVLERLEPERGCLIGAFIDRDDGIDNFMKASQTHGDVDQFNQLTGKRHASFFMYRSYGQPFPTEWAEYLKQRGAIVHLAWEPKSLDQVKDGAYLEGFVDAMVTLDHPVMLRFASEMNGEWTPYHGDPAKYKKAFRLVHAATRRAPKVAMMWCPNTIPRQGMEDYYPGDDAVDWVGVNFYSVPFLDNDRSRPGERIHPTDHLRAVYDRYAARKPIAIGEWAASHQSSATSQPLVRFAKTKISQLYGSLSTRFPRVKMVNWYSSNNIRHAGPSRQLNNYQLTEPPEFLAHYRKAIGSPYYQGAGASGPAPEFRPVFGKVTIGPQARLAFFCKSYEQRPKVYFKVNGRMLLATDEALDWRLSPQTWKAGKNVVEVLIFDAQNRFIASEKLVLMR